LALKQNNVMRKANQAVAQSQNILVGSGPADAVG